jgi:hypothetical protein
MLSAEPLGDRLGFAAFDHAHDVGLTRFTRQGARDRVADRVRLAEFGEQAFVYDQAELSRFYRPYSALTRDNARSAFSRSRLREVVDDLEGEASWDARVSTRRSSSRCSRRSGFRRHSSSAHRPPVVEHSLMESKRSGKNRFLALTARFSVSDRVRFQHVPGNPVC